MDTGGSPIRVDTIDLFTTYCPRCGYPVLVTEHAYKEGDRLLYCPCGSIIARGTLRKYHYTRFSHDTEGLSPQVVIEKLLSHHEFYLLHGHRKGDE